MGKLFQEGSKKECNLIVFTNLSLIASVRERETEIERERVLWEVFL